MKVSFIGPGIMGSRMATNLLKHQVPLTVFNRSAAPMRALTALGARGAESYGDAALEADVVFSMLPSPEVVAQVAMGADGFLQKMKPHAVWVDCSTVNPSFSREAHQAAERTGVEFLDAPVAGTKPHAEKGELVFFVGGGRATLDSVEPLLKFMGSKVVHVGAGGQGSAFKMVVNAMLAQAMLGFSEAVLFGEKLGLPKALLLDALPAMPVSAPFIKAKAEMIRMGDYDAQFPLEWMYKDLHLAAMTAYENHHPLYITNLAKELFGHAKDKGLGREDFSSIYRFLSS